MPLAELLCSISVYQRVLQRPSPRRQNRRALQPCPAHETEPHRISRWSLNSVRFEEKSFLGPGNKTLPGSCSLPLPQLSFRWLSGNDSACQCWRRGFSPWVGKKRQPTPAFLTRLQFTESQRVGHDLAIKQQQQLLEHLSDLKAHKQVFPPQGRDPSPLGQIQQGHQSWGSSQAVPHDRPPGLRLGTGSSWCREGMRPAVGEGKEAEAGPEKRNQRSEVQDETERRGVKMLESESIRNRQRSAGWTVSRWSAVGEPICWVGGLWD